MSARDVRYCPGCKCATGHRRIRINAISGQEDEGLVARTFFGVISGGVSELMADEAHECIECGRRS